MTDSNATSGSSSQTLTLTTGGITLIGVLVSVGATVAFGVNGEWWVRLFAGVVTTLGLMGAVKLGTSSGRGPLVGLARWVIGIDERGEQAGSADE